MSHLMLTLAASLVCATAAFAAPVETTLGPLPTALQEGASFVLRLETKLAPGVAPPAMHVELKNDTGVLQSYHVDSAPGPRQFTFTVPLQGEAPEIHFAVWYGQTWTDPVVPILFTQRIRVMTSAEAATMGTRETQAKLWREAHAAELQKGPVVGVLRDDLPGADRRLAERAIAAFAARGMTVLPLSAQEVCNAALLTPANIGALVLPQCRVFPVDGARALESYLAASGQIIALGAPAFIEGAVQVGGRWMTATQIRNALAQTKPERMLFDFESGAATDWTYSASPGPVATWEYVEGGANGTRTALHCAIPHFSGWNTFVAPTPKQPFSDRQSLTCFWAKGAPQTTSMEIEWTENDGSRWIATVQLGVEWKHYALAPSEFVYWQDNPARNRGGAGDHFRPENAAKLTVGIAKTHTRLADGPHDFWVDEIGTATSPYGFDSTPDTIPLGPVELLTPGYKFHRVTEATALRVSGKQCFLPPEEIPVPANLMSVQPRPQATGFDKQRKWRWVPLLEATNAAGEVCGTPAALMIFTEGAFKGAQVASFCLPSGAYDDAMLDRVAQVAQTMRRGIYLQEGGAQFYAYLQGESVQLGARMMSFPGAPGADAPADLRAKFFVTSEIGTEFERTMPFEGGVAQCTWAPGQFAKSTYQVVCSLVDAQGNALDTLTHPVVIWQPRKNPQFMQIRDGDFWLEGRKWYPHGVNYMPSSGIGIEDGEYFEYWMGSRSYDPVIIQRDLERVRAMGMNMVSIFCYYQSIGSRNLLDILERCRRLDLKVNLSLRPGTPLDFRWEEMKALIETYRLADNDTVFAYDLAWEPSFGPYARRVRWDPAWEQWIIERYGSLESAERDWGMPVPRVEGKVTGPSDQQLSTEGPHRIMVCAYRRFLDDLLSKKHAEANQLVKSIDPNHFTSFRMTSSGDPTANPAGANYDFRGLARSCDIMEPEGYGRNGDWERVKPGRFTADYARAMAPGRPVMWAEFGLAPYGPEALDVSPEQLERTAELYRMFYRMADESCANGTVSWWYPGGYRVGERSDYGIINADGSLRPVSQVIAEWAPKLTAPRDRRPVDEWLTFDRDSTARGLQGVYEAVREQYWKLVDDGKNPGLRSSGFGMTSANAPLVAVGNVPYRLRENPHKYLNAEIDRLEILNSHGVWEAVADGATVKVKPGDTIIARATVGNTGEATWLGAASFGPDGPDETHPGLVSLTCGEASCPIPGDVPYMGTAVIEHFEVCEMRQAMDLVFEMGAWPPELLFGERIHVRVVPEDEA
jgi:hypothetical protein